MEVSPYDSNTENTAYFAARTGSYLYANQPGRTLYLQLCWQKNPRQTVRKPWRKPETINNPVLCQGTR